jgi:hypothetical protein
MMKNNIGLIFIIICGVILMGCGDDFYRNSEKYDKTYFNDAVAALESRKAENVKKLFAEDLQENSDDLDTGIEELLKLYQGKMVSYNESGSETKELANGYKEKYTYYEITTDKGEFCMAYIYQAGGDDKKTGFRHIGMCRLDDSYDYDVNISYEKYEGAYAYCDDAAKERINKKLKEKGFDFEKIKKAYETVKE